MRVLLVGRHGSRDLGGVSAYVDLLAERLPEHGIQVVRFPGPRVEGNAGAAPAPRWVGMGARALLPARYARSVVEASSMRREIDGAIREARPDVVHLHYSGATDLLVLGPLRASGVPVVATAHCGAGSKHLRLAPRWAVRRLREVRWLLCLTRSQADLFRSAGFPAGALRHVPTAVDARFLAPVRRRPRPEPARALYLGRVVPEKGIETLLDAMRRVPRAQSPLLEIVGPAPVPYRARLERAIRRGGLGDRVRLRPPVLAPADRVACLDDADLFVHPSRADVAPLSVIEAMARGLPVVASALPETEEILGGAGRFFPAEDASALAEAVTRLLSDPAARSELGARARARARAFAPEALLRSHVALYAEARDGAA